MKWMPIAFLLILVAAMALRLPELAERPMHHDEANQAYRFGILLEDGTYEYDADDHHGPSLYYLTLPIAWLTGAETFAETNELTYRLLPVIFGLLLILCTPLLRNSMGSIAVISASLLTAISPAMAYYSRFYIQEMSFVFFTFIAIAAGWRSWSGGSRLWALVFGLSAGLMFATKETAIISYAAMFGSAVFCAIASRHVRLPVRNLTIACLAAMAIAYLLFSSFLTNLDGPLDSILAFKGYFERGAGVDTDHVHPWNFYLKMLTCYRFDAGPVWSEALIFGLGIIGCFSILLNKIPAKHNLGLARFLMFYTLLLTAAYTLISYKTPWCMLSFLHGWILLAGVGIASVFEMSKRSRFLCALYTVLLILGCIQLGGIAHRTVFRCAADYRNPYAYAHTSPDFKNLISRINELEAVSNKRKDMYIQVIASPDETWPLPFYLREFPNTGYWIGAGALPTSPKPDIIVSVPTFESSPDAYLTEYYALRADTLLAIHIDASLWNTFIKTRQ